MTRYYQPASASGHRASPSVTVAAAPSSGGFVVGDVTAGAPTNGTTVNFWGSQFWKNNVVQRRHQLRRPQMKGYIDNVTRAIACGVNWTSDPGNSSAPAVDHPGHTCSWSCPAPITQSGSDRSRATSSTWWSSTVARLRAGAGPRRLWGRIIATIC